MVARAFSVLLLTLCGLPVDAQTPANAAPQLSPQAAYDQAVRPLEITRRSPQNWSEAELDALKVATGEAKVSCAARSVDEFAGENLLAYARLCAFAQEWTPVETAASSYLEAYGKADAGEKTEGFPKVSTAYNYKVLASLHLKDSAGAIAAAREMLNTVPYDSLASEAVGATVKYIQLGENQSALSLLLQRQGMVLALLRVKGQGVDLPMGALYADAMALPSMFEFANQSKAAEKAFRELEATLPADLSPDDAILMGETRRQYQLLGAPLTKLATTGWLLDPNAVAGPEINTHFGTATVYLLFPDWCNHCLAMGPSFGPAARRLMESGARFFALLAQVNPPPKPAAKETVKPGRGGTARNAAGIPKVEMQLNIKPTAAALLVGSPTFTVTKETLRGFMSTDYPVIVLVDHEGIVRTMQVGTETALAPGGQVDQLADWAIQHWPVSTP